MPKSMFVCTGLHVPLLALPPPSPGGLVAGGTCIKYTQLYHIHSQPALSPCLSFNRPRGSLLCNDSFFMGRKPPPEFLSKKGYNLSQNFCFVGIKSPPKVVSPMDPTFRHK